jgi:replicative DNA helicase
LAECMSRLKPEESYFYDLRHQTIYQTMVGMNLTNDPIDLLTLVQRLNDLGEMEAVGGFAYLTSIPDATPSAANLDYYLKVLVDKWLLRSVIRVSTENISKAYEHQKNCDEFLGNVEQSVLSIGNANNRPKEKTMRELVRASMAYFEECVENKGNGKLTGLPTGFHDFDRMTNGMKPGDMIVIAGRPSTGKTSWCMNVVEHLAVEQNVPVGIASLEMTAESLVNRMMCSTGRSSVQRLSRGDMNEGDFPRVAAAALKLQKAPIFIDDQGGLSILELRARARRMKQRHDIQFLLIDYLQLLHSDRRNGKRNDEVADISNGVKQIAKELGIPVIVISQLNRELDKDKWRRPRLSDLRESGSIEQDADVVGMLYVPESKNKDPENTDHSDIIDVNMLIAKQRNGSVGDVYFTFFKEYTRYESANRTHEAN